MPFKYRLQVFFLILTILPLLLAGWIIQGVSARNQENQIDARLSTTLAAASRTYTSVVDQARGALRILASQPDVQAALRAGNVKRLNQALGTLSVPQLHAAAYGANGKK